MPFLICLADSFLDQKDIVLGKKRLPIVHNTNNPGNKDNTSIFIPLFPPHPPHFPAYVNRYWAARWTTCWLSNSGMVRNRQEELWKNFYWRWLWRGCVSGMVGCSTKSSLEGLSPTMKVAQTAKFESGEVTG